MASSASLRYLSSFLRFEPFDNCNGVKSNVNVEVPDRCSPVECGVVPRLSELLNLCRFLVTGEQGTREKLPLLGSLSTSVQADLVSVMLCKDSPGLAITRRRYGSGDRGVGGRFDMFITDLSQKSRR